MAIRRRGKNTWEVALDLGLDPVTGKRRRRYITIKGTKRDAETALAEATHERETGIDINPGKITVAEYLQRWMRDYAAHNVGPSTLQFYQGIIVNYLIPTLGNLRLQELRPAHLQSAYSRALTSNRRVTKSGKPLSARSVLHHHRLLKQALKHAVQWQLLARNPADAVTPPRPDKREMKALGATEAAKLLEVARETSLYPILYLALHTGARQGELLALQWQDIDLERGTLYVRRTARRFPGEGIIYRPPKTHRSQRPIALAPKAVQILREHRRQQAEQRLRIGPAYQNNNIVFPSPLGTPMDARNLSRSFARLLTKAGLPTVRFHDLRHTAATLLLKGGVNPKVVSERLGHATVSITLDIYSHVIPDMQREAATVMEQLINSAGG